MYINRQIPDIPTLRNYTRILAYFIITNTASNALLNCSRTFLASVTKVNHIMLHFVGPVTPGRPVVPGGVPFRPGKPSKYQKEHSKTILDFSRDVEIGLLRFFQTFYNY